METLRETSDERISAHKCICIILSSPPAFASRSVLAIAVQPRDARSVSHAAAGCALLCTYGTLCKIIRGAVKEVSVELAPKQATQTQTLHTSRLSIAAVQTTTRERMQRLIIH